MDIKQLKHLVLKWEGGDGSMGRDKADNASKYPCPTPYKGKTGWHTVEGVTYGAWVNVFGHTQDDRFFTMNDEDWFTVFNRSFLQKVGGTAIKSFNVLAVITDIAWMSGVEPGIRNLQRAINDCGGNVVVDGAIGPKTIAAANAIEPRLLIAAIVKFRRIRIEQMAVGDDAKFKKGWMNRTNDYLVSYSVGL